MRVVYNTFAGRYYDSPRALYEALADRPGLTHTWLADPTGRHRIPPGLDQVPYGTPAGLAALEQADVVISNDHLDLDWDKRPEAVYLQAWHGTPLKRIHHDVLWAPPGRLPRLDRDVARWDYLLSPNPVSTERMRRAFGFGGEVLETGLPRNDALSDDRGDKIRAAVRAELGIPDGVTAVLWTPTWRDDLVFGGGPGPDFGLPLDPAEFSARFGADHVLLLRLHSLVTGRPELADGPVRDVSGWSDVRDLYLAADVMVTDYSSTMFDFAVTGKPLIFFAYDLDDYRDRVRGFYFDLAPVAPGPLLRTGAEVLDAIAGLDAVSAGYADRYAAFRRAFCPLDDGHATARVLDRLFPPGAGAGSPTEAGARHVLS
jgi:CDP-glycerol glycerophosphotransferase (TagB/SpsB family)